MNHLYLPFYPRKRQIDKADYDYLKKLDPSDYNWMIGFHCEWVLSSRKHKWKKVHKSKAQFREIYRANNANNRCIYTIHKAMGLLEMGSIPEIDSRFSLQLTEDYMIALIDGFPDYYEEK